MRVTTSKSKNSESFYITRGYINSKGTSTSTVVRKLGTLSDLIVEHGPTRDDVMAWAKEQARIETEKYKQNQETRSVQITFHADREMDYGKQKFYQGGYLFLQQIYYSLRLDKTCRKIRDKHHFKYDINAILSDLVYNRILEPRLLEKKMGNKYTCDEILNALKAMNFADIEEQGYMPLYKREKITDDLHEVSDFRTDFQFITKQKMKSIQKKSKGR